MSQEHKDENEKKEFAYYCPVCRKKYSKEEAKAMGEICCQELLTPLEALYRSDPSPPGA